MSLYAICNFAHSFMHYREFKHLNLPAIDAEILQFWQDEKIFEKSVEQRPIDNAFVFYEGPPSANGKPGIHHVMGRTVKDLFCRYQTLKGHRVDRKGGWDTHGLPIELSVEKELGITKEDIGKKITVEEYNAACRSTVLRYKDLWEEKTRLMGYWADLEHPYITFENSYIETVWYMLKRLYDKGLLYKGYTIQPYSPAAGTGLSSHELNMPGTYHDVTDTTIVAMFKVQRDTRSEFLYDEEKEDLRILAWTTTPWTLPSNTALTVGPTIPYVKVKTHNPYTKADVSVVLAEALVDKWFGGKNQPEVLVQSDPFIGRQLADIRYEQLLPYAQPMDGEAFKVITDGFVTTEDGTGVVHTAPSFGADDMRVARQYGIGSLTLVDKQGKFTDEAGEFAGRYVKDYKNEADYQSVDVDIAVKLKTEGYAFNVQKYVHSYPHCWRTDKPILYYPLDSWFVAASKAKDRLVELNKTINWKPASTGEGRFGQWLENLQDWNLSRSRYWGIPLPIWRTEDGTEEICIGSVLELEAEIEKARRHLAPNPSPEREGGDLVERDEAMAEFQGSWFKTTSPERWKVLKDFARRMRKEQTPGEAAMWDLLRDKQLDGIKFRRQHAIEEFIADFVSLEYKLVVEVDGTIHDFQPEHDQMRTELLRAVGFDVVRFTNEEVLNSKYKTIDRLRGILKKREAELIAQKDPTPNPSPEREGNLRSILAKDSQNLGASHHIPQGTADIQENTTMKSPSPEREGNLRSILAKDSQNLGASHHIPQGTADIQENTTMKSPSLSGEGLGVGSFDLHRPYIDDIILVSPTGKPMRRELDLIDVWFDSGSMPYAQWGLDYEKLKNGDDKPFKTPFEVSYPADFIAEGVDQTRGWFYTLHAIAGMVYDSVAFRNVVSNGLVLDKNGEKMSKSKGNVVDPFETLTEFGADATRWYMMANANPWDNLKFDTAGIIEVRNKLFGTLYNTYNFFALYANLDGFRHDEFNVLPYEKRTELDRWIISKLYSLVAEYRAAMDNYDVTRACRAVEDFVDEHLSNWYVRLSRRRFWKSSPAILYTNPPGTTDAQENTTMRSPSLPGEGLRVGSDKTAAYQTLFECLLVTNQLMAPVAPFFSDWMYRNLTAPIKDVAKAKNTPLRHDSVHLSDLTPLQPFLVDKALEKRMDYAQRICSLALSIRKKEGLRVRLPLQKIMLPVLDAAFSKEVEGVKDLILSEINVKQIEFITDAGGLLKKGAKANFKTLGAKLGKDMKAAAGLIAGFTNDDINLLETAGLEILVHGNRYMITADDLIITTEDLPGWKTASDGALTVALDVHLTDALLAEGTARDLVNRIQNIRKDKGFNVTDRIIVILERHPAILVAVEEFSDYIKAEVLANQLRLADQVDAEQVLMEDEVMLRIAVMVD